MSQHMSQHSPWQNHLHRWPSGTQSPSNDQTDALTKAGALHEKSWTFHALPHCHITSVRCWRSPHPPKCGFVTANHGSSHVRPIRTSHFLHGPKHILRAPHAPLLLHLRDGVLTYVPEPLTAPKLVVPHGQRGIMLTHAHDAPWCVANSNRQIQTTDMKRGKIKPTDTDRQPYALHHTSISIVILGKHIATMLRHNPYSLLRSTARTNL